jgi:predicted extracellular nuclease
MIRFQLSTGDFVQDWSTASSLLSNDNWDLLNGIMGYRGDDIVTTTAVDPRTVTSAASSSVVVDVTLGQTNPSNATLTGGVLLFASIADPTIALNGSGTADAPSIVLFLDSTDRQDIRFRANIRDIDASADNAIQQVVVQWRVAGGSWNNVAYVADATTASSDTQVTPIDVTLPAGANGSASLEIRIITTNAAGNDEAIGIDDIIVSSIPLAGGDITPPALIGTNPTDPDDGATAVPLASDIVLRFSETVVAGTGSFTLSNGTDVRVIPVTDAQVTISGNTVTINPSIDLVAGTTYMLTAPAGTLEDSAGNDFGGIASGVLDFTTVQPLINRTIGAIQGLGHSSVFVGQMVETDGVVTAIDSNGFYIQSALGASDGDSRTSDGIFVFTNTAPAVTLGSLLRVMATVQEFRPGGDTRNLTITQLSSPTWLNLGTAVAESVIIGTGGRLPPAQIIDNDGFGTYDPHEDGIDFWETLEGMLVTIDTPVAISNTNSFGETYVVASGAAGATGQSAGGGLTISADDFNPERIQLDNDNGLFAGFNNQFTIGDRLSNVTGVVSYSFQAYEVLVTQAVSTTLDVTATKQVTSLVEAADKLSVASYNLENLSANDSPAKIASLASDIVNSLKSPDIIAVQEVQDADGAGNGSDLSGVPTANVLIAAIVAAGGPTYLYVEIAPSAPRTTGGEPGGNIRNGYLYDPSRVSLVPGSVQLIDSAAFANSRKPLVATFEFNGEILTLINVHFTSRGGSDALWGSTQPPANAGDAARTAQGETVRAFIDGQLASSAVANIAVLGDFNGFSWEGGIGALTRGGLMTNLSDLLPAAERYSYQFDGNNQQLDHIVATGPLFQRAQFDAVQINSQLPSARQISTDHDAALALFSIAPPADTTAPTVTTFAPTDGAPNVVASSNVALTFNEAIALGAGTIEIRSGSATGTIVESFNAATSSRLAVSGSTLTIDPTSNLASGTQYFVVIPSGAIRDTAGNAYAGTSAYDFTTASQVQPNRLVLSSQASAGAIAATYDVFGTNAGNETLLVYDGTTANLAGDFNRGGDTVALSGLASSFTIQRSGSSALLTSQADQITVRVPVGVTGTRIVFENQLGQLGDVRTLLFDGTNVVLGTQVVDLTATVVTVTPPAPPAGFQPIVPGNSSTQSGRLVLSSGGTASAVAGKYDVFGTNAGNETLTVLDGTSVNLAGDFNRGGDIVRLSGRAGDFVMQRSGSSVVISSLFDDITARIPVGIAGMQVVFQDGAGQFNDTRTLLFNGTNVLLGTQVVGLTAAGVTPLLNSPPVLANAIADQTVAEDTAWSYQVPANAFSDPDGDSLFLAATLADGSALPSWLTFNASSRTFSGTPPLNFNGNIDLKVTASDGALRASDTFRLSVVSTEPAFTDEFQINTFFEGTELAVVMAALPSGGWLAAYGSQNAVYGQLISSTGQKVGVEKALSFSAATGQVINGQSPALLTLANGNVVVSWTAGDGNGSGVFYQLINEGLNFIGTPQLANFLTQGEQSTVWNHPRNTMAQLPNGDWVMVWQSRGQDGSGEGVFMRKFAENGTPIGGDVQVNAAVTGEQIAPAVTALPDGRIAVVWTTEPNPEAGREVVGRIFDGSLAPITGDFLVNTKTADEQQAPAITALANGNWVAAWMGRTSPFDWDVYVQIFDSAGNKVGGEFIANDYRFSDQHSITLDGLSDGRWVITWSSVGQDGSDFGIFSRVFSASGVPLTDDIAVNTYTLGRQIQPSVAVNKDDNWFIAWHSDEQDGFSSGVFGRMFLLETVETFAIA